MESNNGLLKLIKNTLEDNSLNEEVAYAPVYNSKIMLERINNFFTGGFNEIFFFENFEKNLAENNVGLLAAKTLDSSESSSLQQYANNLHTIWADFLSMLKMPHRTYDQLNTPERKAYDYYKKQQGFQKNHNKIMDHLDGIDFSKPINDQYALQKHCLLAQWRAKHVPHGDYYANCKENNPSRLGIYHKQEDRLTRTITRRLQYFYRITSENGIEVLKSTARAVLDTWSIKNKSYQTCGGAAQYFNCNDRIYFKELP